jgi:hypothetical protein
MPQRRRHLKAKNRRARGDSEGRGSGTADADTFTPQADVCDADIEGPDGTRCRAAGENDTAARTHGFSTSRPAGFRQARAQLAASSPEQVLSRRNAVRRVPGGAVRERLRAWLRQSPWTRHVPGIGAQAASDDQSPPATFHRIRHRTIERDAGYHSRRQSAEAGTTDGDGHSPSPTRRSA